MAGFTHENVDNKSVEWYTPEYIFTDLGLQFDLDPCHPEQRLDWIPVKDTYCKADDGLSKDWYGNVWLNPPYGVHTKQWLSKMHQHRNGIALVFARTDTAWFKDYCAKADAILFLHGRIKFVDGAKVSSGNTSGSGSMLIAWGSTNVEALKQLSHKGLFVNLT